jgi:MiaB/RimO family radical SAM methylthiotransferase
MTIKPTKKNVYISTNGCVGAQISTKSLGKYIDANNLNLIKNVKKADFIIFYACGLTEKSENGSLRIIRNLKRLNPKAKLIIWGCLAKQNPKTVAEIYDGPSIGPLDINLIPELIGAKPTTSNIFKASAYPSELRKYQETSWVIEDNIEPLTNIVSISKQCYNKVWYNTHKKLHLFYIYVATGCTGNCTFCSERPVFGKIKSRPIDEILSEFKQGLTMGYTRFSLLATDLGAYGTDMNSNVCDLLRKIIDTNSNENYSLILNQVEPFNLKTVFPDLLDILGSGKIEELMSPVQSGSNRILKLMGRKYTIEEWKNYMSEIKKKFPNIRLNTHFMVGFPTETEEDFNETLKILDTPLLDDMYVFKYSSRPTALSKNISPQIPEETKELRRKRLMKYFTQTRKSNKR